MMKKLLSIMLALLVVPAVSQENGYGVGDAVENFRLKNVDGKEVGLDSYQGAIVIFTCNTCPVANAYEQRVLELDKKYRQKGYPVLAINPNDPAASRGDSFDEMKKRASEKKYSFPYLLDTDQVVTRRFGATRTPHVFVLQKEGGKHKVRYIGAIDDDQNGSPRSRYVEEAVQALLKGGQPSTTFTKAVGCGIKWKRTS